jgi:hypothetical protein
LGALCAALAVSDRNESDAKDLIDEIYDLMPLCNGIKGRPYIIKEVYRTKKTMFYDEEKNASVEEWIDKYVLPYEEAIRLSEEELFKELPERPYIRPCSMESCKGFCCYDGVYLLPGEEDKIKKFIKENSDEFVLRLKDYFMDGNFRGIVQGRKTSVKNCPHMEDNYPKHFEQTQCIFADENYLCQLQLAATKRGMHPWAVKPKACWMFPLDAEGGNVVPPPDTGEADPMYCDETYPGYVTCLHCGKAADSGISWRKNLKQEILYYNHMKKISDSGDTIK